MFDKRKGGGGLASSLAIAIAMALAIADAWRRGHSCQHMYRRQCGEACLATRRRAERGLCTVAPAGRSGGVSAPIEPVTKGKRAGEMRVLTVVQFSQWVEEP